MARPQETVSIFGKDSWGTAGAPLQLNITKFTFRPKMVAYSLKTSKYILKIAQIFFSAHFDFIELDEFHLDPPFCSSHAYFKRPFSEHNHTLTLHQPTNTLLLLLWRRNLHLPVMNFSIWLDFFSYLVFSSISFWPAARAKWEMSAIET